eukprot:CAMPEP_0185161308 /NCGR_PEP_ID=MMETSP1139-20130426/4785_1 /TAXON_ID=298111 /ORGANISM="Pavlova sp., Strain CCMP459" /LENGTH=78 /DNA_ID=CAMNT_0027726561 /DNA_START=527 /DNA_END=759 /DNA_ORIENTATION=+
MTGPSTPIWTMACMPSTDLTDGGRVNGGSHTETWPGPGLTRSSGPGRGRWLPAEACCGNKRGMPVADEAEAKSRQVKA